MSGGMDMYDQKMGSGVGGDVAQLLQEPLIGQELAQPVTVAPQATIAEAIKTMNANRVGCVLVVEDDRVVGIFTERDVLRGAGELDKYAQVRAHMTPNPECLDGTDRIVHALAMMVEGGYRHVPVLTDGKPVGVFGMRSAMALVLDLHEEVLVTAPPRASGYARAAEGA